MHEVRTVSGDATKVITLLDRSSVQSCRSGRVLVTQLAGVVLERHRLHRFAPLDPRLGVVSCIKFLLRLMGCTVHARKLETYHQRYTLRRWNVPVSDDIHAA